MARTKMTARRGGSVWCRQRKISCYERAARSSDPHHASSSVSTSVSTPTLPIQTGRYFLRPRTRSHTASIAKARAILRPFKFSNLPTEIQNTIWELIANSPRIVVTSISPPDPPTGFLPLTSSVPKILHICTASRAIGSKYYELAFACQRLTILTEPLPATIYFNFEKDILYFRPSWNQGINGSVCCINEFIHRIDPSDLKRVQGIGFDIYTWLCSTRIDPSDSNHRTRFSKLPEYTHTGSWDALETIYLGLEKPPLGEHLVSNAELGFGELRSEDEAEFMKAYGEMWGKSEVLDDGINQDDDAEDDGYVDFPVVWQGGPDRGIREIGGWLKRVGLPTPDSSGLLFKKFQPVSVFVC